MSRFPVRRALVWFAWFLLSGRVFHGKTERELREVTRMQWLFGLGALAICLAAVAWFLAVIPTGIRNYLLIGIGLGVSLGSIPFLVQTAFGKLSFGLRRYL